MRCAETGEKFFTPQRNTSKTAAGDRGKLVKGFSRVTKRMEMKELMIWVVVLANFWGWDFARASGCGCKWLSDVEVEIGV